MVKARGSRPAKRSAAQRALDKLQADQRADSDHRFRQLHPAKAAEERALRKAQAKQADDFGHKRNGTPETHAKAAGTKQGALARLHQSGSISIEQLGSAQEIAAEAERVAAEVRVRTASLETRVDAGGRGALMAWESLGRVRRAQAYSRWRTAVSEAGGRLGAAPVLAMIVEDIGIVAASRHFRMNPRRARRLLIEAIDLWPNVLGEAIREIDAADLARVERRLI